MATKIKLADRMSNATTDLSRKDAEVIAQELRDLMHTIEEVVDSLEGIEDAEDKSERDELLEYNESIISDLLADLDTLGFTR